MKIGSLIEAAGIGAHGYDRDFVYLPMKIGSLIEATSGNSGPGSPVGYLPMKIGSLIEASTAALVWPTRWRLSADEDRQPH